VDATEAYTLAAELESLNVQRRTLTEQAQLAAEAQLLLAMEADAPMLFVRSPSLPSGIVGLVAGKLTDRFYRPAVVVEEGPDESRGSARSIAEFDISRALDAVSGYLVRHGGHSRAAGFTVKTPDLAPFQAALLQVADEALRERAALRPTLWIDAEVKLEELNWGARDQLARLEPTGYQNPTPRLLARNVRVRDLRTVGSGKHLRLVLDEDPHSPVVDGVAFSQGEWAKSLRIGDRLDVVFQLEANEWQGRQQLQLNIQDLRLAGDGPPLAVGQPVPEE
jgi:single-stranded-DNA-specific exonuclease